MTEGLNFQIEKIAGLASESTECGVVNKKIILQSGEIGNLVCCILVRGAEDSQSQIIIRDIFEIAERKLDGSDGPILDLLKSFLTNSRSYLDGQGAEVSFVSAFFYKEACYVVRLGEDVKLLVYSGSNKAEITFETGSGPVKAGQTYLIATDNFLSLFDEATFSSENIELSEIIDGMATEISAKVDQAAIGAVFVKVAASSDSQAESLMEEESEVQEEVLSDVPEVVEEESRIKNRRVDEGVEKMEAGMEDGVESELGEFEPRPVHQEVKANFMELVFGAIATGLGKLNHEFKRIRHGEMGAILGLRRKILVIIILIVLVLAGVGGYSIYRKDQAAKVQELQDHLTTARSKLNEGSAIIELNKTKARQIFVEAQDEAKAAQKINSRDKSVEKLLLEIEAKLKETETTSNINFSTFAELDESVKSLGFRGSNVEAFLGNKITEVDTLGKTVGSYGDFSDLKSAVIFDSKAFILTGSQVFRLDFAGEKVTKIADAAGEGDIGVFFGNVYLLGQKQISKIVPIEGGYSQASDYLDHETQFGSNSRMAIDSLIWATNGSKILKFNRGAEENFEISGLPEGSGEFGLIYTDSGLSNLYVVDRSNSVLLVIGKDGVYKKALSASEFGKASAILVNSAEDKVYVAQDSKILTTGLK